MKRDWEKVLDQQLHLIAWARGEHGKTWANWFLNTAPGIAKLQGSPTEALLAFERLLTADTVFVTRDMCDLIEHAYREMPPIRLEPHMMFWESAFIMYERPIEIYWHIKEEGASARVTAMQSMVESVLDADALAEGKREYVPGVIHVTYVNLREQMGVSYQDVGTSHFPFDLSGWAFGKEWIIVDERDRDSGGKQVDIALADQRKLMLATHLIAAQKLAMVSGNKPSRNLARRAAPLMPEYGEIKVVTLRRAYVPSFDHEPDHEDVEWSHRWIVRGHWRKQYYPSRGEHDLVWIAPYVKGPEDKPLIVKDKVFNLKR